MLTALTLRTIHGPFDPDIAGSMRWLWVPVDPTAANADRARPVNSFVGNDRGDLLVLHVDVDFELPFPDQLRPCDTMQLGTYFFAWGEGTYDGVVGPTGWEVRTKPIGR